MANTPRPGGAWQDGVSPITAAELNRIEGNTADAATRLAVVESEPILNTDTTGAAVGKVVAATAVDGSGVPTFGLQSMTPTMGSRVVLLGDSLVNRTCILPGKDTAVGTSPPAWGYSQQGWWAWAQVALRHRMTLLAEAGISGQTADQIRARIATDVIPLAPDWCIVRAGTNDILASNTPDPAPIISSLAGIIADLRRAGIRVAIFAVPPIGSSSATVGRDTAIARVNRALAGLARATPGVHFVNTYPLLADPVTGRPLTGVMESDGVHMSALGSAKEAKPLVALLAQMVPGIDDLGATNADTQNLLANGQLTGDTSGLATSWALYKNGTVDATPTKVASTDDYPHPWQQVVHASGETFLYHAAVVMTSAGLVTGDTVYGQIEFETEPGATIEHFYLDVRYRTTGAFQLSSRDMMTLSTPWPSAYLPRSGVLRTPPVAIPATTDRVELGLFVKATSLTYRIRRAQLVKI